MQTKVHYADKRGRSTVRGSIKFSVAEKIRVTVEKELWRAQKENQLILTEKLPSNANVKDKGNAGLRRRRQRIASLVLRQVDRRRINCRKLPFSAQKVNGGTERERFNEGG